MSVRHPPQDQAPVTSDHALTDVWRSLLRWEPIRHRTLWLLFLDQGLRPAGPLLTVDNLADGPYDLQVADLVVMCRYVLDGPGGGGSVAMLLTRPGGQPWTVSDRAWGRFLLRGAAAVGGRVWPVHLAHPQHLEQFELPRAG